MLHLQVLIKYSLRPCQKNKDPGFSSVFRISSFGSVNFLMNHPKLHQRPKTPFGTLQTSQNATRWDVYREGHET